MLRSTIAWRRGDWNASVDLLKRAMLRSRPPSLRIRLVRRLREHRLLDEADVALAPFLWSTGADQEVIEGLELGLKNALEGSRHARALRFLTRLLELRPFDSRLLAVKLAHFRATATLDDLRAYALERPESLRSFAAACRDQGQTAEALYQYRTLARRQPTPEDLEEIARLLAPVDPTAASRLYRSRLSWRWDEAAADRFESLLFEQRDRDGLAELSLRRHRQHPGDHFRLDAAVKSLLAAGRHGEALNLLHESLRQHPERVALLWEFLNISQRIDPARLRLVPDLVDRSGMATSDRNQLAGLATIVSSSVPAPEVELRLRRRLFTHHGVVEEDRRIAWLLSHLGRELEAETFLRARIAAGGGNVALLHADLCDLKLGQGDRVAAAEAAREAWRAARRSLPRHSPWTVEELREIAIDRTFAASGDRELEVLLREIVAAGHAPTLGLLADHLLRGGRTDEAVEALSTSTDLVHRRRAMEIELERGHTESALAIARRLKARSRSSGALDGVVHVLVDSGRFAAALDLARRSPISKELRRELGAECARRGYWRTARRLHAESSATTSEGRELRRDALRDVEVLSRAASFEGASLFAVSASLLWPVEDRWRIRASFDRAESHGSGDPSDAAGAGPTRLAGLSMIAESRFLAGQCRVRGGPLASIVSKGSAEGRRLGATADLSLDQSIGLVELATFRWTLSLNRPEEHVFRFGEFTFRSGAAMEAGIRPASEVLLGLRIEGHRHEAVSAPLTDRLVLSPSFQWELLRGDVALTLAAETAHVRHRHISGPTVPDSDSATASVAGEWLFGGAGLRVQSRLAGGLAYAPEATPLWLASLRGVLRPSVHLEVALSGRIEQFLPADGRPVAALFLDLSLIWRW